MTDMTPRLEPILKKLPDDPLLREFAEQFLQGASAHMLEVLGAAALQSLVQGRFAFFQEAVAQGGALRVQPKVDDPDDPESLIHSIRCGEVEGFAEEGIVHGGMLPKLRSAVEAIEAGVGKVHLVDGRIGHSLLLEIFTKSGVGTEIVP